MTHVDANLMGTPGLQHTFDQCDMVEILKNLIMRDGVFAGRIVRRKHSHLKTVLGVAPDIAFYAARRR